MNRVQRKKQLQKANVTPRATKTKKEEESSEESLSGKEPPP